MIDFWKIAHSENSPVSHIWMYKSLISRWYESLKYVSLYYKDYGSRVREMEIESISFKRVFQFFDLVDAKMT